MSTLRVVRHVSGNGEQYVVAGETSVSWRIKTPSNSDISLYDLPKSEYSLVPPPERWADVTGECAVYYQPNDSLLCHIGTRVCEKNGYRLRKVLLSGAGLSTLPAGECWAFLVERKEST